MDITVSAAGAVSILGKGIDEQRVRLFENQPRPAPFAPKPEKLRLLPPEFEMLPLEKELLHYSEIMGFPLSRNSVLALMALEECLANSFWSRAELNEKRVAFIMGTTAGCSSTDSKYSQKFTLDQGPDPSPYNNALKQDPANILKNFLSLKKADVFLINNACTSSTDAVGLGAKLLEHNKYDVIFAGGSDEIVFQSFCGFNALQLVSPKNRCSPFDKNRDGLLLTEAAALLCLERPADFLKRTGGSKKPLGQVIGYESVTESFHQTGPHPDAEGLQSITSTLFKKSGLTIEDLSFINAHGTGTPSNDSSEGKFFARFMPGVPIVATKGYTGHCLGAVGALEAIFTLLSFEEKKLPISLGFLEIDPAIAVAPTTEITPLDLNKRAVALSTSVGFGGVNSALLLRANGESPT